MPDNRSRIYALESWTVERKRRGWFIKRTYATEAWLGPYRTEMSACLMIARHMRKEIIRRDAPPQQLPLETHPNGAQLSSALD
jgi:hypothetical protein